MQMNFYLKIFERKKKEKKRERLRRSKKGVLTLKWKKNSTVITVYRQEPKELGWGTKTGAPAFIIHGYKE